MGNLKTIKDQELTLRREGAEYMSFMTWLGRRYTVFPDGAGASAELDRALDLYGEYLSTTLQVYRLKNRFQYESSVSHSPGA